MKTKLPWNRKNYPQCPNDCGWLTSGYCPCIETWNHNGKSECYPSIDSPCLDEIRNKSK